MAYYPTESLDVTWKARNASWRRLSEHARDVETDLPRDMRHLTLDDLPNTDPGKLVKGWCKRWWPFPQSGLPLGIMESDRRGKGLFLVGPPGVGKTTMACIAAQHLSDLGWSTKFVRAQDYYSLGIAAMRAKDEEEQERLQAAFDCYEAGWEGWRLVVLDDLGHEHRTSTGWSENVINNLIRSRFTDGAPTIVTSNIDPDSKEFAKRYGVALQDYIHEAFWTQTVAGESMR